MSVKILQGDVFEVLPTLAPGSIDCCVTSPPYWMLRSYLPANHELKPRELGSEKTVADYVANMVRVFDLVRTALADHGTCWLNVGDTYNAYNANRGDSAGQLEGRRNNAHAKVSEGLMARDLDAGNLCLIPQRLMIALQDAGWIVRSVVIWHKPAPMPTSVSGWMWRRCRVKTKSGWGSDGTAPHPGTINGGSARVPNSGGKKTAGIAEWSDCPGCKKCKPHGGFVLRRGSWRPTSSYEPVIMLAKSTNYFADGEPVKTTPKAATVSREQYSRVLDDPGEQFAVKHDHETFCDGANLRDVWTIAAEPLKEKHYAAYPTALVEKCLRAGTSAKGYCPTCGAPWVRVVESVDTGKRQKKGDNWDTGEGAHGSFHRNGREQGERDQPVMANRTIDWKPSCTCPAAEPRPGLVLDPFAGSGRTAITAQQLGLDAVLCELNPEYAAMSRRIIREDSPLFAGVE